VEKRHLFIRPKSPIQVDGIIRSGDDIIAHIITDVDVQSLASMILFGKVIVTEAEQVSQPEPDAGDGEGSSESEFPGSTTDEPDAGPSLQPVPQQPAPPSEENTETQAEKLVAYYVLSGINESAAEALAKAVATEGVKDREMLRTIEGIRQWVANGNDLSDLPDIGRIRKAAIEKAIEA
jgi:hypothetical protein